MIVAQVVNNVAVALWIELMRKMQNIVKPLQ